ncbi:methyl-accepting chemotaxis protein [Corallococcus sp. AB032C]|uniref:methyl-accepting chemotaxis protein n=1 Tax=Corallococcus TaxID=83461 RepID=UPI000EC51750|nr:MULTISPECIES: methyl-accepting chemotaxis protein [Corallococcus]NNB89255.1 methyl-accepting chemotaxis protein [Corallococcus exiguus]NPC49518.1 methyl-accepting chemotaxis protein [Corallococcus exiguus]RKH80909.1 methyl-accepting chemotaxis protein [Corallococcus sp. AB032C]
MNETQDIRDLAWRGMWLFLRWVLPPSIVCAYLIAMVMGLSSQEGLLVTATVLPFIVLVFGLLHPYVTLRWLAGQALRRRHGDGPGDRLRRVLELPWRSMVFTTCAAWTLGGFFFSLPVCLWFGKDWFRLGLGTLIAFCFGVVVAFPIALGLERLVLPWALREQDAHPELTPAGSGPFWPRQSWFLPLTFLSTIFATVVLSACVVVVKLLAVRTLLQEVLLADGATQAAARLDDVGSSLFADLGFALPWVGALVFVLPAFTTWMLARRQATSASAVHGAISGLASGRIRSPRWVSTDEMGDLASGMNGALSRLRRFPRLLQTSAQRLGQAGTELRVSNEEQQQGLTRQAAALHEAQVTSEELRRASRIAADSAEEVLRVARRAETLGQQGEAAVVLSLEGLSAIRSAVSGIQQRLSRLEESTVQIGEITGAVKDLADQSHLLAVNAAIEAARSGEAGRGFAVVAKEIRGLSDQSVQATRRIRDILADISQGIRDAASMSEQGGRRVAAGLDQMRASGESLRALSHSSQESSEAARKIANAVTQQNAAFSQITTVIADLSQLMDGTLHRLSSTQEATRTLQVVSGEVGQMALQFDVQEAESVSTPVPPRLRGQGKAA